MSFGKLSLVLPDQANARDEPLQERNSRRVGEVPPFIVRQFERAYTLELRKSDSTGRPDKIRAVSCI